MKRSIGALPLLALMLGAAAPLPAPTVIAADPAAANRVRATVEFLADDLLEGRDTGARGHLIAARFVASEFRALGLEPGGTDGGWTLDVPLRRAWHDGTPTASVTSDGGRRALAWRQDIEFAPSFTQAKRWIDAPLVFAGWGLTDQRLGRADYRGIDVRGKIALVFSGVPKGLPVDAGSYLRSSKAKFAAAAGAIGLITVPAPGSKRGEKLRPDDGSPDINWVDREGRSGGGGGPEPKGLQLRGALSLAEAERLFARTAKGFDAVRTEAASHPVRGFALRQRLTIEARSRWEDFSSPAVIGRLPGSDPRLAREHVLLMAHLDHLGIKTDAKPGEDRIYNGALDNAVGVATMIEVAREFVDSRVAPKRSLLFVAATGEEKGLLGSSYFASHPTVPIGDVAAAVDLDMPLPLYDFTDVVAFGADHSSIGRTVAEAGAGMGVALSPDFMPEQGVFTRSDHYSFVLQGVPAVLLATGQANGGKPVWDAFLGGRYHSVADDLSQPIRWPQAARYALLNYRITRALADDAARPSWLPGDYFGGIAPSRAPSAP